MYLLPSAQSEIYIRGGILDKIHHIAAALRSQRQINCLRITESEVILSLSHSASMFPKFPSLLIHNAAESFTFPDAVPPATPMRKGFFSNIFEADSERS